MTRLYGVMGYPIEHSLSPCMHQAAYTALGIDAVYAPFAVDPKQLGKQLKALWDLGVCGLNVTVPLKQAVLKYVDEVDETAQVMGAVNTLVRTKDKVLGYNTDGIGFRKGLESLGWKAKKQEAVVLGAGGAARAVLWELAKVRGIRIVVANRTESKAKSLVRWIKVQNPQVDITVSSLKDLDLEESRLLVNTTTVGMKAKDKSIVSAKALHENLYVYDLVYNRKTELIKQAVKAGCTAGGGETMLVHQGAEAFRLWFKKKPSVAVMQSALESALKKGR